MTTRQQRLRGEGRPGCRSVHLCRGVIAVGCAALVLLTTGWASAEVVLTDAGSPIYYRYAVVAGGGVTVFNSAEVAGDVHANQDVEVKNQAQVVGDVSAVGEVDVKGTVDGTVTEGAPPLGLPELADEAAWRALADRVFEADVSFVDEVVDDLVFVDGDVDLDGAVDGRGTIVASGSIAARTAAPEPGTLLSLVAFGSIVVHNGDRLRGVLYAGDDVELKNSAAVEGVIVASGQVDLKNGASVTFLNPDGTPPEITFTEPAPGAFLPTATPTVAASWRDALSGVDPSTTVLTVDAVDRTAEAAVGADGLSWTAPAALADGGRTVEVALADRAGNAAFASLAFVTDTVPPELALTAPPAGVIFNRLAPEIAVAFSDTTSGVDPGGVAVSIDGVDVTATCTVEAGSALCLPPAQTEGAHSIRAAVSDRAGHAVSAEVAVVLRLDGEGPELAIAAPTAPLLFNEVEPEVRIEYADAVSGVALATFALTVDGIDATDSCSVGAAAAVCAPLLEEGERLIGASIADLAGNPATAQRTVTLVVDLEPPEVVVTEPAESVLFNELSPQLRVAMSDGVSGIDAATFRVLLDGEDVTAGCAVADGEASCPTSALSVGSHELVAEVADLAGNVGLGQRSFSLLADETPPFVTVLRPSSALVQVDDLPSILVAYEDDGAGVDPATVRVGLDGADLTASCSVGESSATCAAPPLGVGPHTVSAVAADGAGNSASAAFAFEVFFDRLPPVLSIVSPAAPTVIGEAMPEIVVEYADDRSGVDLGSLAVAVDGQAVVCAPGASSASCTPPALAQGPHTVTASLADLEGNVAETSLAFDLTLALPLEITEPAGRLLTRAGTVTVAGTVSPVAETVTVAGLEAAVSAGTFFVEGVPLHEGTNTLTAVARSGGGGIGSATVTVVRDTAPPRVSIRSPRDGFVTASSEILVTGEVFDATSSHAEVKALAVEVNGVEAALANRAFFVPQLLLQPGENRIVAECVDAAGNVGRAEITVVSRPDALLRIEEVAGNRQSAPVATALAEPLVVRLADVAGNPLPDRRVTFAVSRGDGEVLAFPDSGSELTVLTDGQGMAEVQMTLGRRAGAGAHEVTASSPGLAGEVIFCATGEAEPAVRIATIVADDPTGAKTGVVGRPLPKPLLIQLFDRFGNPVPGGEVTYRVVAGGGSLGGEPSLTTVTDEEGKAAAVFTLGPEPGLNNQVVEASFPGLEGLPATFVVSGVEAGPEPETALSGLVLDPQDGPIPGATVTVQGSGPSALTDALGQFRIDGVPVGTLAVVVDAGTTPREGTWPTLSFDVTTLPGIDTTLGKAIRIPPLDAAGAKSVGGAEDVVIPMQGIPGAELTVRAGSATFPDGATTGLVSFTQVPADKVPMQAPLGSSFDLAWTIQPPGVHFDPPAKVSMPNFGGPDGVGAPPGAVFELYAFDHDLEEFVSAGTVAVTADRTRLVSTPGSGISKSGWGGIPGPRPNPTNVCNAEIEGVTIEVGGDPGEVLAPLGQTVPFRAEVEGRCTRKSVTWDFGDGAAGSGDTVAHAFEATGPFTVSVEVSCAECQEGGTASDSIPVRVADFGLSVDGLADGSQEPPNEILPGAFLAVNDDDDDADGVVDLEQSGPVAGEDDLLEVEIDLDAELRTGTLTLGLDGDGEIRVYTDLARTEVLELPREWDLEEESPPDRVFLEAVEPAPLRDLRLFLELQAPRVPLAGDSLRLTALDFVLLPGDEEVSADFPQASLAAGFFVPTDEDPFATLDDDSRVVWQVEEGSGSLDVSESPTENGVALATLEMPATSEETSRVRAELQSVALGGETYDIPAIARSTGEVRVVPGDPATIELQKSDTSLPADDTSTLTLTATARDEAGNLVADGTSVFWDLEGLGDLVSLEEETVNGAATAVLRAPFLPEDQIVDVQVGEVEETVTIPTSKVEITLTFDKSELDVAAGETAGLTATFVGEFGEPIADGAPIFWFTSSGAITGDGAVFGGTAEAVLTSIGGRIGDALIALSLASTVETKEFPFISSAPVVATIADPVLVGNATEDGTFPVEQIDGTFLDIPFVTQTTVTFQGEPGTVLVPRLSSGEDVAAYPFDEVVAGRVEDRVGGNDGVVLDATLDQEIFGVAPASLRFAGEGTVSIAPHPSLQFGSDLELSIQVRPEAIHRATILEKAGEFALTLENDGRVTFSVFPDGVPTPVTSLEPLVPGTWHLIAARFVGGELEVAVDGLASFHAAAGQLRSTANPLLLGKAYRGHLDELLVTRADATAAGSLELVGVGTMGQVFLDSAGSAQLTIRVASPSQAVSRQLERKNSDPTSQLIRLLYGVSEDPGTGFHQQEVAVLVVADQLYAVLWNFIEGFRVGRGEGIPAIAGDVVAGLLFYGDIRDVVLELLKLARGESPNGWVLGFAAVGIWLDFGQLVPQVEVLNVFLASAKTIMRRLAKEARGPFLSLVTRLARDATILAADGKPLEAQRLVERVSLLLLLLVSKGDEATELIQNFVRSSKSLDDLAKLVEESGEEALELLLKFPTARFFDVFSRLDPGLRNSMLASQEIAESLARVVDVGDVTPRYLAEALSNPKAYSITGQAISYTPERLVLDLDELVQFSSSIPGLKKRLRKVAETDNPGDVLEIASAAHLLREGEVIRGISVKGLDELKVDILGEVGLYQVVLSETALLRKANIDVFSTPRDEVLEELRAVFVGVAEELGRNPDVAGKPFVVLLPQGQVLADDIVEGVFKSEGLARLNFGGVLDVPF